MNSQLNISGNVGGAAIDGQLLRSGGGGENHTTILAAGNAGQLTTRTDADTGVVTVAAGHTVVSGKVDVYWTEGGVLGKRIGMDALVTNDQDTTINIDAGAGDNLPTNLTEVVIANQVAITAAFDGDDVKLFAASCSRRGSLTLIDGGNATIKTIDFPEAKAAYFWADDQGVANPITGNAITHAVASNGSIIAATLAFGVDLVS